jgi:acetolactate synthase-1/2/3 large subunit
MKVSDYIIEFLISKNVTDIFGYPGGVICHVMDSITKYRDKITAHALYHEQACAFAACSYAQGTHGLGAAFATSGPGATNLVTGIANAYYDSIPVIFLTGNVDTYGVKGDMKIRQRGFQETDFVSIVQSITRYSVFVTSPDDIAYCLEKACYLAAHGRSGPVVLDLPADVQRAEVDINTLKHFEVGNEENAAEGTEDLINDLINDLNTAKRPCILAGAAIKQTGKDALLKEICETANIPLAASLPAIDILPGNHMLNGGFIGTNGHRYANFIICKSDVLITIGTRLELKQTGNKRELFAPDAKLYRVDIDAGELSFKVRNNEIPLHIDLSVFLEKLKGNLHKIKNNNTAWVDVCKQLKSKLQNVDADPYHDAIRELSKTIPSNVNIVADTGQSSVWVPQAFVFKENQTFFVSAGLGSMGYSLPAAIGSYYANKRPVLSFNGDAGIQMNIQELEYISKENLPVTIVILNNFAMGMIRQFQEKNFSKNYNLTTVESGYAAPDFEKIAHAYAFVYKKIVSVDEIQHYVYNANEPSIIDIQLGVTTYLLPNFSGGKPLNDMDPPIDRELYAELTRL